LYRKLLDADRATNDAAEKYRAVARNYLDALAHSSLLTLDAR
jgi:hypothetical protein